LFAGIGLSKFQGFDSAMDFQLKPLTFIFGPNASGKSSITRSLLLLRQSLTSDTSFFSSSLIGFAYDGPDVSLASFANVVHRHDESSEMEISVRLDDIQQSLQRTSQLVSVVRSVSISYQIGMQPPFNGMSVSFEIDGVDEGVNLEFKYDNRTLKLVKFHGLDQLSLLQSSIGRSLPFQLSEDDEVLADLDFPPFGAMPPITGDDPGTWEELAESANFRIKNNFPTMIGAPRRGDFDPAKTRLLDDLLATAKFSLIKHLREVRHVGPLRNISERLSYEAGLVEDDLESGGSSVPGQSTERVVSDWLLALTNGRYKFQPVEFYAEPVRFLGSLKSQILVDTASDTPVTFADVGVGLSQVLPILQALQVRQRRASATTVLIEQPELHLHPAMQANLADLFADAVTSNPKLQIVAETHSESMLLRLQKRMRDGKLDPNLVQILYVDQGPAGNQVTSIIPDVDDDFAVTMPLSFTKLRLEDLL
jgi:hypothetical protein